MCFSRAKDNASDQEVAIKRLNQPFQHTDAAKRTLRELRLLRFFKDHDNLLTVIDSFTSGTSEQEMEDIYFVTVLMEADLSSVLRNEEMPLLPREHAMFFMYQIVRGLKYLHSAGIIHRVSFFCQRTYASLTI